MVNERDYIQSNIKKNTRKGTLGVVTKVWQHDDPDDVSNHEVNARLINGDEEFRRVPVHVSRPGNVSVPQVGDFVSLAFNNSMTQKPYVNGFAYSAENRAPLGRAGHWRHRFGDSSPYLFVEAEKSDHSSGDPDVVRMSKKSDGLSDPTTSVEIDDSGSTTQVNIETDGDINISAGGDIVIDEGGTAKSVLTEDAVFEYEDTGDTSDGSASPTTKTTSTVSNGAVTETDIE